MSKRRLIDFALLAAIALLLLTPATSYIKRYLNPNNSIEISNESKNLLVEESLNLNLEGFNTNNIKLKDKTKKLLLVHVWGTWCGDCRLEMPEFQQFYNKYKNKINFVLISFERGEDYTKVLPYIQKNGFNLPFYKAVDRIPEQLITSSYPTTFIIDKNNNILEKHEGATNWNDPKVIKQIEELLIK